MINVQEYIEDHLKEIGINNDSNVLDFGCGNGNYTIHIAQILGDLGKVYAIDEDKIKLNNLKKKAIKVNVDNRIQIMKSSGEFEIPLENEIIDISLLYNVTCCIIGQDKFSNFVEIANDIHRVLKDDGRLIIGIKEGETMLTRIEKALPLIQNRFSLVKKEKGKYFDGEKLRPGLFYFLKKMI